MTPRRRSLKGILTLWFIIFSIVPLAFVFGYLLLSFESALSTELMKRLEGNIREVAVTLSDLQDVAVAHSKIHSTDPSMAYYLATRNIPASRRIVTQQLSSVSGPNTIVLFDREGRLVVAQSRMSDSKIKTQSDLESGDFFLPDSIMDRLKKESHVRVREVKPGIGLKLIVYTRVIHKKNQTAGYLEETFQLGDAFLNSVKKRLKADVILFDKDRNPVLTTREDFGSFPKGFFGEKLGQAQGSYFSLTSRGESFGVIIKRITDTHGETYATFGLAASQSESRKVLQRLQFTMLIMGIVILLLLIPTQIFVTNRVVKPIHLLVDAAEKMQAGEEVPRLPVESGTEVGMLVETFNRMSQTITLGRRDLEKKIMEVQKAHEDLQNTQGTLVQSAKMASLGQLVAGVAHELNNPIGFIYSNMAHLREYVEKLKKVLELAENEPQKVADFKKQVDFDFIIEDLPKLISSCEEGARRTRDIVMGLRNFSRVGDVTFETVDLHDGLRNTLKLLSGELKNRIKVHEQFGSLPAVRCMPSQINQVFVNIIGNSAQAIEKDGEIWIKTSLDGEFAVISIKDNGPGISKENLDKIFDPFFTTKEVGKGTGLGLSISYGIVQKHGGEINVTSKLGKGTEFVVRLPVSGPSEQQNS